MSEALGGAAMVVHVRDEGTEVEVRRSVLWEGVLGGEELMLKLSPLVMFQLVRR